MAPRIAWNRATAEELANPRLVLGLLERAIQRAPDSAEPRVRLGNVYVDLYDFGKAARIYESALACDSTRLDIRLRLSRALIVCQRFGEVLALLEGTASNDSSEAAEIHYARGIALQGVDRSDEAKAAFAAALDARPGHRRALMKYADCLRHEGKIGELLDTCEALSAAGADHGQLMVEWGRALALAGDMERARRLLFDPSRVTVVQLDLPHGFNCALAEELTANPFRIRTFPPGEEANRGSSRVHHLMSGHRPDLPCAMMSAIRGAVDALLITLEPRGSFDPWVRAAPAAAHLHAWGLVQRGRDYEEWHTHRGGWLSGAYYVRLPEGLSAERGCIEYGPPPSIADRVGNAIVSRRYPPAEGMLILAPSHYHHRTIPSGIDEDRISFAFDVVPDDKPTIS